MNTKAPTVKPLPPLAEQVAQMLLGIECVPKDYARKMVARVVREVAKWELKREKS